MRRTTVFVCLLVLGWGSATHAATLYIDPASTTLNRGDTVRLAVRIDTDEAAGECINAVSGVITYGGSVEPVDISRGNSIFQVWVEEPTIDTTARTISFAGGIPNGYCGRIAGDPRLTNTVLELVFRSPALQIGGGAARNEATVDFTDATEIYLNDGRGTRADVRTFGTTLTLSDQVSGRLDDPWLDAVAADNRPPEEFSIVLSRDERAFGGRYFIAFNTTDKQTGIDHYEVIEEPLADLSRFSWGGVDAPWVEARSPYVLQDQTLNSTIRVRAIDKAGNEYVATLVPDAALRTRSVADLALYAVAGLGVLILFVVVVVALLARRRRKEARQAVTTSDYDPID